MYIQKIKEVMLWFFLVLIVSACGGGSGENNTTPVNKPTPTIVWDKTNWDQSTWQ